MDYRAIARQKAKKYGLDPHVFERQIGQESGFNPRAVSPAGARGIAQIMPGTAKGWGVDPMNAVAALDAAAKNMAGYVKTYGGYENALRAYNAGPAAIEKSKGYAETNNYVKTILGGREPGAKLRPISKAPSRQAQPDARRARPEAPVTRRRPGTMPTLTPAKTTTDVSGALLQSLVMGKKGRMGRSLLQTAAGLIDTGQYTTSTPAVVTPYEQGKLVRVRAKAPARSAQRVERSGSGGSSGAGAALAWAQGHIGFKEATGNNDGGIADYANKRFGFKNAPWCAMFTSMASTKGGAPKSMRTASVAEVLAKASRGEGYQRGTVAIGKAKAGDLITFGTNHIGMVEKVGGGKVTFVAGNDGNGVQRRSVAVSQAGLQIVRPLYGRR